MARNCQQLGARLTEERCLQAVFVSQRGIAPCPACDSRVGFAPTAKRRGLSCKDCGFLVYPLVNTPFARTSPTLRDWFLAIYLAAGTDKLTARDLRAALGIDQPPAEDLIAGIEDLRTSGWATEQGGDWFEAVREFTEAEADTLPRAPSDHPAPAVSRVLNSSEFRWHYVGAIAIACLALAGAGIGWMLVPPPPEEDQELVQATAILSLASAKPVILVSAEVAAQLYDVSDADDDANSPLKASIRRASAGSDSATGMDGAPGAPLAQPSIKLAPSIGQSLLQGDLSGVKGRAGARSDLAAYDALAKELEGRGPRNPDELLIFGPIKIRRHLVEKIIRAARTVQMDPVLLMAIADKESSFATEVQAKTSSATGLFQFIERTWLGVLRDFGAKHGLIQEAELARGDLQGQERARILEMRRDAFISAVFAAEMLRRDSLRIEKRIGRPLSGGEIYLVHFLGPDGAERLIERVAAAPSAPAAELLPKPAEANKSIFYTTSAEGGAKTVSVSELKEKFETMISVRLQRYRNVHGVAGPEQGPAAPSRR